MSLFEEYRNLLAGQRGYSDFVRELPLLNAIKARAEELRTQRGCCGASHACSVVRHRLVFLQDGAEVERVSFVCPILRGDCPTRQAADLIQRFSIFNRKAPHEHFVNADSRS